MSVILGEIAGDADQPGRCPIDRLGLLGAEALQDEPFEIAAVVHQPVEIEQALVDDVLIAGPLILDDHW